MLMISTSGPLGKYLTISPPLAIWYRAVIAFVVLFVIVRIRGISLKIAVTRDRGRIVFISVLMAFHLITYFFSLQYANVAIGMLSLFTYPIITALLEPLFLDVKFDFLHLVFGFLLLIGVFLLLPSVDLNDKIFWGIVFGLCSAISYSVRNILLKQISEHYDGMSLMTFQTFIISLLLLPTAFAYSHDALATDWWALLTLGIVTTAFGHSLFIHTFQFFTISKVSILSGVQPLLGILLAVIFLNEVPSTKTILGGVIILGLVIIEGARKDKLETQETKM